MEFGGVAEIAGGVRGRRLRLAGVAAMKSEGTATTINSEE